MPCSIAADNALAGLEGEAALLRRLGDVAAARAGSFGSPARLGNLYDYWLPQRARCPRRILLRPVLRALGPIWPGRPSLAGVPLGDCGATVRLPATASCRCTS